MTKTLHIILSLILGTYIIWLPSLLSHLIGLPPYYSSLIAETPAALLITFFTLLIGCYSVNCYAMYKFTELIGNLFAVLRRN